MKISINILILTVFSMFSTIDNISCPAILPPPINEKIESPTLIGCGDEILFEYTKDVVLLWNRVDTASAYLITIKDMFSDGEEIERYFSDTIANLGTLKRGVYRVDLQAITDEYEISPPKKSNCYISITNNIPDMRASECGKLLSQDESIEWGVKNFSSEYKLQISTNPEFTDGLYVPEYIMKPSYDFHSTNLEPSTTYYWRVRGGNYFSSATSEQYESDWSETCSFTTDSWNSVSLINPADIKVRIEADKIYLDEIDPNSSLQILNMRGEILTTSVGRSIDKSNLSRGAYFLLINNEEMIKVVL